MDERLLKKVAFPISPQHGAISKLYTVQDTFHKPFCMTHTIHNIF